MPNKNDQESERFHHVVANEASIRYCVAFDENMQNFPQSGDDDDLVVGIAAFPDSSHGASSSSRLIHECVRRILLSYRRETAQDWGNQLFLSTIDYKERLSELADEWRKSQGVTYLLSYRKETAQDWENLLSLLKNDYKERFSELADEWRRSQGVTSNLTQIVMNPAYQQIIGMGEIAVPLIFNELEREPDHWFWALKSITGVDPVTDENRGNIRKMAEEWLDWGKRRGYHW